MKRISSLVALFLATAIGPILAGCNTSAARDDGSAEVELLNIKEIAK